MHGALRTAIGGGTDPKTGQPDYTALGQTREIHARGAILVAAVFDAFLKIYQAKTADLRRIATGGTGILPQGEIEPDLVHRFAAEASQLASQFLLMCIRALDYCPRSISTSRLLVGKIAPITTWCRTTLGATASLLRKVF